MKVLKTKISLLVLIILILPLFYVSCHKEEQVKPKPDGKDSLIAKQDSIRNVKEFIYDITTFWYLWTDKIPGNINVDSYDDPHKLFEDMYYPTLDHWSFVTDNYKKLQDDLDGKRKAAGFRFRPFLYETGGNDIYFLVEFVYPDGNAYKAGLRRGDVIIKVDGEKPNKKNYRNLLSKDQLNLSIGKIEEAKVVDLNKTITVTKIVQDFSPIVKDTIIVKNNKKIGYFLFDQFISKYDDEMEGVIQSFKNDGIDELVLDLRYNSGGYVSTCAKLGSNLVPPINIGKTFLTYQWNAKVTQEFNADKKKYGKHLKKDFPEPQVNLNLQNLYVLSSRSTASASEAIVNCLRPYMNVVLIGDTTSGKYTAVNVFSDRDKPAKHNWAIFLVTSRIANANGVTDYINGFVPDYLVQDNMLTPLGDENEPLFAKAIELITNSSTKNAIQELPENFQLLESVSENRFEKEGLMIMDDN